MDLKNLFKVVLSTNSRHFLIMVHSISKSSLTGLYYFIYLKVSLSFFFPTFSPICPAISLKTFVTIICHQENVQYFSVNCEPD